MTSLELAYCCSPLLAARIAREYASSVNKPRKMHQVLTSPKYRPQTSLT